MPPIARAAEAAPVLQLDLDHSSRLIGRLDRTGNLDGILAILARDDRLAVEQHAPAKVIDLVP